MSLTVKERVALEQALDATHQAWSCYTQLLQDFGYVQPFVELREAENQRVHQLERLMSRNQVPRPRNKWVGRVRRHRSIGEALRCCLATEEAFVSQMESLAARLPEGEVCRTLLGMSRTSHLRLLPALRKAS